MVSCGPTAAAGVTQIGIAEQGDYGFGMQLGLAHYGGSVGHPPLSGKTLTGGAVKLHRQNAEDLWAVPVWSSIGR